MSEIVKIEFDEQSEDIKKRVEGYWSKRAESFFALKEGEAESCHGDRWKKEIEKALPTGRPLKILDIGCGAGFFEAILTNELYEITGIDLTGTMISKAQEMIRVRGLDAKRIKAMVMDAENLEFENESFDVIISRNLTWTLPHPVDAYREWFRVLKKGGVLLNFDAEYARHAHENLYSEDNLAHKELSREMKDECHRIYHMLTISALRRPAWDEKILKEIGFTKIVTDTAFGDKIYLEKDRFYVPDALFSIVATK